MNPYIAIKQKKQWITLQLKDYLTEDLRLSDLTKNAGLSKFSKKFSKETNKLMGNPTNHTKLVQMKVNKVKDYITFIFLTERTPKYKDNFHTQVVDPSDMSLQLDNLYTIEVRVLDFFKLLNTRPDKTDITNKDIEDVLMTASIQWWSDVPSFQLQGSNYLLTTFDAAIYPEHRPPKRWNKFHHDDNFLDKHSAGIANSIKFFIPIMRQMVKKYLGLTKK